MKIDHMALYAEDLEAMKAFYVTFFGASTGSGYYNPGTGLRTCFLTFGDGARLELMTRPGVKAEGVPPLRTGYAHLAVTPGDREQVDRLTEWLRQAGYQVVSGPRVTGDGYYESCVLDPEGNSVEITASGGEGAAT